MAHRPSAAPRPTLAQLAAQLGVHKSTVSRAMDPARRHLIGPELLQRVQAAATRLGYRPDRAAAALASGRSGTVGVLLPDITNPVFPPILRGIEDALDAAGYFALLANTARGDGDAAATQAAAQAAVERMLAQRVEGFLVATAVRDDAWLERLRRSGARIVLVNRSDDGGLLPAVTSDDALGMRLAVQHLVDLGHRRIAHLAGPQQLSTGRARRDGVLSALRDAGLEAAGIAEAPAFTIDAGDDAAATLLRGRAGDAVPFTALVAANDLLALGALQALQRAGLSVPRDVSVVGHNDMPLLAQLQPPLTSVRIQHYEMGHRAARLLLDALRGEPGTASTLVLRPSLVVRGSTAPPRRAGRAARAARAGGATS